MDLKKRGFFQSDFIFALKERDGVEIGKNMDSNFQKAVALYKENKTDAALKMFLRCDSNSENSADIAYYLGLCYTKQKKYDEAVLFLEQVIANHTNILFIYQCRMILSYIYAVTAQYRLAEHELEKLVSEGYESAQIYSSYGYVAYHQKRVEEALDYYRKALECDPDYPNALNSIGYILADENINTKEALLCCEKANKITAGYYPFLDSLGWAYYKNGEYKKAVDYLKEAFRLGGSNKIIAKHLKFAMEAAKES